MEKIRIFLVDDDESIHHMLSRIIAKEEDMQIVGKCVSVKETLSQIVNTSANMALISTQILGMKGVDAAYWLRDVLGYDGSIIMLAESADDILDNIEDYIVDYYFSKDAQLTGLAPVMRQVHSTRHQLKVFRGFMEESVELIVPSSTNDAPLLQFMYHLQERLHESNIARIFKTIGARDKGSRITIRIKYGRIYDFLELLRDMIDIIALKEEKAAGITFSSLAKKIVGIKESYVNSNKRFRITLKQMDVDEPEVASKFFYASNN